MLNSTPVRDLIMGRILAGGTEIAGRVEVRLSVRGNIELRQDM